jgi:flagellar basal body rod protein FlgG
VKKITLAFFLVIIAHELLAQDFIDLKTDLENLWSPGLRPLSQGKECYVRTQGSLQGTLIETDFAISGSGFFALLEKSKNKIFLTRNGSFSFNHAGYLINHDGMYVLNWKSNLANNFFVFITKEDFKQNEQNSRSGLSFLGLDDLKDYSNRHPFY